MLVRLSVLIIYFIGLILTHILYNWVKTAHGKVDAAGWFALITMWIFTPLVIIGFLSYLLKEFIKSRLPKK